MKFRSSKTFHNLPCAHRRYAHQGHCAFVHGYSRSFTLWFESESREEGTGFVMDFGGLKEVKSWLEDHFDHTMLLDAKDPLLPQFQDLERQGACKLVVFDDVGMEGSAKYVYDFVSSWVSRKTSGRVTLYSVECRENDKNSAIYIAE
jgi:6-pyruvoyltetrahydropterin/6-carboxytetrahydropterin synthase